MAKRTNIKTPQFIPSGGIGTIWKDFRDDKTWKYTAQGWAESSTGNILADIKAKGTFDVKPEEEDFVKKAYQGGLTETQIIQGLNVKRQKLPIGNQEDAPLETRDKQTPFGGMTKQEVFRDAHLKGMTEASEFKELEDIYDFLMGTGEKTDEEQKAYDFKLGKDIITLNVDASSEELRATMLEETNLDVSEINALLQESGAKEKEDLLTDEEMKKEAIDMVKEFSGFFDDSTEGKQKAIDEIENDESLTRGERKRIVEFIEEEYPEGRSFLQKLFPKGK